MVIPRKGELSSNDIFPLRIWSFIQSNISLRVMLVKSACLTADFSAVAADSADENDAVLVPGAADVCVRWVV